MAAFRKNYMMNTYRQPQPLNGRTVYSSVCQPSNVNDPCNPSVTVSTASTTTTKATTKSTAAAAHHKGGAEPTTTKATTAAGATTAKTSGATSAVLVKTEHALVVLFSIILASI
jgi:hypothetical protein